MRDMFGNTRFRIRIVLFIFLTGFLTVLKASAHIERTYYLTAELGQQILAVKMICYDETPVRYISYFFDDSKKDRFLSGTNVNGVWRFKPKAGEMDKAGKEEGSLLISEGKNGIWEGSWVAGEKDQKVILKPITKAEATSRFSHLQMVQELDPYEAFRLSKVDLIKTRTERMSKDIWCDWLREAESDRSFFRIRSTSAASNTDTINTVLEALNLSLIREGFRFDQEDVKKKVETELLYLSDELLSFSISTKVENEISPESTTRQLFTFDVRTGKEVDLESIVWFDKKTQKPSDKDLEQIYKYRQEKYAPKVLEILKELYPDKIKNNACDLNNPAIWAVTDWAISKKGLVLSFFTNDTCNVFSWALIPFKKLEPYLENTYHFKN